MGILSNIHSYAPKWVLISREKFTDEDIESVDSIEVVASNFGISAQINMKEGEIKYIPLQRDLDFPVGTVLEPAKCYLLTFKRIDQYCEKIDYEK